MLNWNKTKTKSINNIFNRRNIFINIVLSQLAKFRKSDEVENIYTGNDKLNIKKIQQAS